MMQDFGWSSSARRYLALYRELAPPAPLTAGEREQASVVPARGRAQASAA
jgi:hypothetical protein